MKFAFIAARDVAFPVSAMCRVLGVTRSGFYAWQKRPRPARAKSDAQLAERLLPCICAVAARMAALACTESCWLEACASGRSTLSV